MKPNLSCAVLSICLVAPAIPADAQAQAAAAPPRVYTGSFGAGLAITGGNTATKNFNLTFDLTRDPKTKNVIKANALYIRSNANGVTTGDHLALGFRDEYSLSKRAFVYAALPYVRDPFKQISYLINPQGGFGYKLVTTDKNTFTLSGGLGAVWEKDIGIDVKTSGTINAGQSYSYKLSDTTSIRFNYPYSMPITRRAPRSLPRSPTSARRPARCAPPDTSPADCRDGKTYQRPR
jgi:putative salt-induced outer membrane protein YdiY